MMISWAGVLILIGFVFFAGLMVAKVLPALLALPLLAAWCAIVVQMPLVNYLNDILLGGSMKLASAMAVVIFGAMFARVIMKTGISSTIIKKSAELAGDKPLAIALVMTCATAFVFLGMSGLGAVIMVGSIALPIMMSAGIEPVTSCALLLLGLQTGLMANAANYGTYIGIFGGAITASYYLIACGISLLVTIIFIFINVPAIQEDGTQVHPGQGLVWLLKGLCQLPVVLLTSLGYYVKSLGKDSGSSLLQKRQEIPAIALLAPLLPLLTVYVFKFTVGFGTSAQGQINPLAASVCGFILACVYAILLTRPKQLINILAGGLVEGIKDVAGVIFLFMGIGMLVAAVMNPAVAKILNPLLTTIIPSSRWGAFVFFVILAPAALYRGPLNMFGMGAGIAVLLVTLHILPPEVVCGAFLGVQYIQGASDPTNSHNTWIGGFANVDTLPILKKTLPYTWLMCVLMQLYVVLCKW
jgi:H+/gluconate symporter-like permease